MIQPEASLNSFSGFIGLREEGSCEGEEDHWELWKHIKGTQNL
jgi:hypothetical protein